MKLEKLEGSEVLITVLKEGKEYKELREGVLKKFKNTKIDGFRKGHAPLDVIEKTFEKDINEALINEVLKNEYSKLLKDENIRPMSDLQLSNLEINKDLLKLEFKLAVFPEFELPQYTGLDVKLEEVSVSDEEIEKQLELLVNRSKKFEGTDKEVAENGDIAVINFEGFVDGIAFQGGKAENHKLELGSKSFIDTFEEQIVGHKVGDEFDVNVKFPEQYHSEELKGKEALFKVKLNSLEVAVLPELNDEFAKLNGADSLEDLKNTLKANILSGKENNAKNDKLNTILLKLEEATTMDVPSIAVESEIDNQLSRFDQQLQMQGMNLNLYLEQTGNTIEKMREDLRERATKGIKTSLILTKISEKENISVSQEEFSQELDKVASMYGMDVNTLNAELEKSGSVDKFYNQISSQLFFTKMHVYLLENN